MAIFNTETAEYRHWKYRVDEFQILITGEDAITRQYDLPRERVQNLMLLDNYEVNKIPVFRIELILEANTYYDILKNKNRTKFRIKFVRFYEVVGQEKYYENTEEAEASSVYHSYIDDTFDLLLNDSDADAQLGLKEEKTDNSEGDVITTDENEPEYIKNNCEFMLYKSATLTKLKTIVNFILQNATMADAICYICSKAGLDNILMAVPENQQVYSTIVVPPMEAYEAIKFLDSYYGLARTGYIFYFGFERAYFIKYNGICNCYLENEIKTTTFVIPKKTSEHINTTCSVYDSDSSETNYIYCNQETINMRNETITSNMITGTSVNVVDKYYGTVTNATADAIIKGDVSVKTVYNKTENIYYKDIYQSLVEANSTIVEISVSGYDITAITPNKEFNIAFEDTSISAKYNGTYILTYAYHNWIRDGDNFNLASTLVLKKSTATY